MVLSKCTTLRILFNVLYCIFVVPRQPVMHHQTLPDSISQQGEQLQPSSGEPVMALSYVCLNQTGV